MRQLILETIDDEIIGKRAACSVSAAMWSRRRRGEAMVVNGNLRIKALSTARNAGGTPVRQLIVEIVDGETTRERIAWSLPTVIGCSDDEAKLYLSVVTAALRHCLQ